MLYLVDFLVFNLVLALACLIMILMTFHVHPTRLVDAFYITTDWMARVGHVEY